MTVLWVFWRKTMSDAMIDVVVISNVLLLTLSTDEFSACLSINFIGVVVDQKVKLFDRIE